MNKETANNLLKFHADFHNKNSFLYCVKENSEVNINLFHEIMNCLMSLSDGMLNKDQIKNIYGIIFWCRSWLDAGWLEKELGTVLKDNLVTYIEIIENALYYLMQDDPDEAF